MIFLPKAALLTAWEWERHGPPPAVLGADNLWLGDETRKRLEEQVLAVLTSLRLAAGGTLTREFRDVLHVLARGAHQFTAWLGDIEADESGAALVSASGPDALRLIRKDDTVRIDVVEPSRLAESLVDVLPPVPPARISAVSIPEARFSGRAVEESYDLADPTLDRGPDPLPWARRLMAARRTGLHQCYAVNRGSRSAPITAVDIAGTGRVLTYVYPGRERMVSFQPGTRAALTEVLYATLNGLGGGR
ncbi:MULTISPECIES: ESX secretion-associated protein EspG [Amycolatopsis]|uniref:ESX secretion-associated protein EspG n=1 Tax=Amycolatopsis bullii TaxID=941987 RepID=A0ABQ3KS84_9PSEU|nr:ESX secretion-associated protein EspG [Amycolatopsis bullii]GHG43370.1 ESX secretion-associated protein EspG [Amycolatopsis bullii]